MTPAGIRALKSRTTALERSAFSAAKTDGLSKPCLRAQAIHRVRDLDSRQDLAASAPLPEGHRGGSLVFLTVFAHSDHPRTAVITVGKSATSGLLRSWGACRGWPSSSCGPASCFRPLP
jgi:hypothetical protein